MTIDDVATDDEANNAFEALLANVVQQLHPRRHEHVARALLFFLIRIGNTWHSIRTLQKHSRDPEIFTVDAGALIRTMFDAYLQAAYIVSEPNAKEERARLYLDFEHVDRKKMMDRLLVGNTPVGKHLRTSPNRAAGTAQVDTEYDRVKANYLVEKRVKGKLQRGPGTRTKWYKPDLAQLAQLLGKTAEHDLLIIPYHGCIHSSSFSVRLGPPFTAPHVLMLASTIAAKVAALVVQEYDLPLNDFFTNLLNVVKELPEINPRTEQASNG